jgi:hypothetical protein
METIKYFGSCPHQVGDLIVLSGRASHRYIIKKIEIEFPYTILHVEKAVSPWYYAGMVLFWIIAISIAVVSNLWLASKLPIGE